MPICSSGTQCPLYSAASLGKQVIGPHVNPPSHIILTPGRPVMFRGPSFIVSTMQEETTSIFKRLWYDWTQQQPGIEPTNPLGQCWFPPLVAFYDQQGLLRTYSLPGGSIRSPHPGFPRGHKLRSAKSIAISSKPLMWFSFSLSDHLPPENWNRPSPHQKQRNFLMSHLIGIT